MTKRIVAILILLPLAIIIVALALANREPVTLAVPNLDGSPLLSTQAPLFAVLFTVLLLGMVIGSLGTWMGQARHRKAARDHKLEANKAAFEAEKRREQAQELARQQNEHATHGLVGNDLTVTPDARPAVNARAAALGLPAPSPRKVA